ncbi:MAG: hypothetical protein A2162_12605 [Deltaproteobacteria bacterium RBG_13_52_11b]|nr:MAG: hypothetical protein A2162_12605 [Deltaproteobacteria bacterium RBG_13_52_11b]
MKSLKRRLDFSIIMPVLLLYRFFIIWCFIMLMAYESFLTKKGALKSRYVAFYLKWVSDCCELLNEPLSNRLNSEQKQQFLTQMARQQEDWQVRQAYMDQRPSRAHPEQCT